jgi:hypothetical protein
VFKILVFSLSCILLLSGCGKKKATSSRVQMAEKAKLQKKQEAEKVAAEKLAEEQAQKNLAAKTLEEQQAQEAAAKKAADEKKAQETAAQKAVDDVTVQGSGVPKAVDEMKTQETAAPKVVDAKKAQDTAAPKAADTKKAQDSAAPKAADTKKAQDTAAPKAADTKKATGDQTKPKISEVDDSKKIDKKTDSSNPEKMVAINLTSEEAKLFKETAMSQINPNAIPSLSKPALPAGTDVKTLTVQMSGTYDKFNYSFLISGKSIFEFKDIKLKDNEFNSDIKSGDYSMIAVCSGIKCDVLFVTVYKLLNNKIIENYPSLLKRVDDKYVPTKMIQITEETEKVVTQ